MIIYPPFLMIYLSFSSSFRSALLSFCPAFSPPASQTSPVSRLLFVVVSALLLVGFLFLFDVQDEVMHRVFFHDFHTSFLVLLSLFFFFLLFFLLCLFFFFYFLFIFLIFIFVCTNSSCFSSLFSYFSFISFTFHLYCSTSSSAL